MVRRARPPPALFSVNQMLPSGPTVIPVGGTLPEKALCVGTGKDVKTLVSGLKRQTMLPLTSVSQRLPSGPLTMAFGENFPAGAGIGVMAPAGVTRASRPLPAMMGRLGCEGFGVASPSAVT